MACEKILLGVDSLGEEVYIVAHVLQCSCPKPDNHAFNWLLEQMPKQESKCFNKEK